MYSRALAIAFCILTLACGATAPAPTPSPTPAPPPPSRTFTLSGHVSDVNTGGPLAGATITILDGDNASRFTTSDAIGAFHLTDVIFGGFTVRVRHDAYDSVFRGITFVQDTSIDVQMRPVMQSLSGTWTGTFSFSPANEARQDLNVPQLTMEH